MSYYADTSFLVAAYAREPESVKALRWMQSFNDSLAFTPLHRHELRTALRLKVFRGEISEGEMKESFRAMDSDLDDNTLKHTPIPWTDAFREAERISESYDESLGARSLDLLHLGIALALKSRSFLTFDARQARLAEAAGLKLVFGSRGQYQK